MIDRREWVACGMIVFFLAVTGAFAGVNVLTYHNDNGRTGQNLNETILTPTNVNETTFGKLGSYSVDGQVYTQPLYVSDLLVPGKGVRNVVFVATQHNTVYAFDADSNAGPDRGLIWLTNLGPSAITPNNDFGNRYQPYPDIRPEVGITGTPVIDLAAGTLFVDAFTHEGTNYVHRLHALNIANGTERANSPVVVGASIAGVGAGSVGGRQIFQARQQLQRSALTLAGGILYITYCGYGDTDPYHGWIIGYDPATLQQLTNYVYNTTPNSTTSAFGPYAGEGGIWMAGGGLSVDTNTNLYFEVGNGIFDATNNSGGTELGDCFIRLSTVNGLAVTDYFAPYNQQELQDDDRDLGSGGLLIVPDQPGVVPHLLVGAGKEGKIYVINRDQMTAGNHHYNAAGSVDYVLQTITGKIKGSFDTPAYFNGRIYYAAVGDQLKAFALNNGLLVPNPVSVGPRIFGFPGSTPSVTANGTNDGIIWTLQMGTPAILAAYDPVNLTTELYNSTNAPGNRDQLPTGTKFAVPTIANGKVYIGGQYSLSIFGLLEQTNLFVSPNIAPQGTGILGTKTAVNSGAETTLIHAGIVGSVNDGDSATRVDTFNGTGTDTASYVGVLWSQPITNPIVRLELSLAIFYDGGWFGVNNVGPGVGGMLSAALHLVEPTVQVTTNGGSSWTTVAHTSDYLQALNGYQLPIVVSGPPTHVTTHFQLSDAQPGINGVRIIGSEGGTASGGFLGVFELAVYTSKPEPVKLMNVTVVNGQLQFEFDSQPTVTHVVQFKTLDAPNWQTLTTVSGDGSRKQVVDSLTGAQCIYRVTSQ